MKLRSSATLIKFALLLNTSTVIESFIETLELGNLFLNDRMEVKIGDFGLATKTRVRW
jgi:hypothetical protein